MSELRPKPVLTKTDFARRYIQGEFGNASPSWKTVSEFLGSLASIDPFPLGRLYSLRASKASAKTQYNLRPSELVEQWSALEAGGETGWYASQMAPTQDTVFNAELYICPEKGLRLFYATGPYTMKEGLKLNGRELTGVAAKMFLQTKMPHRDYEWLMYLLEEGYPDHIVEFTTYSRSFGTVPGFKTVYWEVRKGY